MSEAARTDDRPGLAILAFAFGLVAFESVGGGLAAWTQRMIVEERRWLTEEEYLSASTICGILPGANQVNMAVFVGTRYRGPAGAAAAVAGLVAGPAIVVLLLGALYLRFRDVPALRHVLSGMSCAAAGLTLSVAWRQGMHVLTKPAPIALAAATFAFSVVWRMPLWFTVATLAPIGFAWAWRVQAARAAARP